VMVMGGPGVSDPFTEAGLEPVAVQEKNTDVDAIFIGWFREFSIEDLEVACEAAWRGAKIFAASVAPFYATSEGRTLGTSCAIAAMIRSITGCRAKVLGKPSQEALRAAARRIGVAPRDLAVVGDDPALEIPMALRGGAMAVAVHSAVGSADVFAAMPADARPQIEVRDIAELASLYHRASGG